MVSFFTEYPEFLVVLLKWNQPSLKTEKTHKLQDEDVCVNLSI